MNSSTPSPAPLTPKQEAEIRRLVEEEHVPEVQALAIVTEVQLDYPIGADGRSTVRRRRSS